MGFIGWLVRHRKWRWARELMLVYGLEVPAQVEIGSSFQVFHRGIGTIIHPSTRIGDRVSIFHGVTIGRSDPHIAWSESSMERIEIGDDAILFAGCVVLGNTGVTRVGRGTIVAANAVLTKSTGEWEVWGGVPARRIGVRTPTGDSE